MEVSFTHGGDPGSILGCGVFTIFNQTLITFEDFLLRKER